MLVYLAGGINGNCKPLYKDWLNALEKGGNTLNIYLAGTASRRWVMDVYLAGSMYGNQGRAMQEFEGKRPPLCDIAILESFFYADEYTEKMIPHLKHFLLDSGAFTFMNSTKGKPVDWYDYLDKYAAFIKRNNVKHFFELDIDSIVGYEKVLEFRRILEEKTGRKCIPVWHRSRGKEEFIKMCKEYDYVAFGGLLTDGVPTKLILKHLPWFINTAHKYGAKIHGLGFTNLKGLEKYHFDSVDSTSWTSGNRFGSVYKFNGRTLTKVDKKDGQRLKDSKAVAIHNFNEWVKFQRYAEKHL